MNSLCFAVAPTLPIVFAGREYEIRPATLADLAAVEMQLRRERGEPATLAATCAEILGDDLPALAAKVSKWGADDQRANRANPLTLGDLLGWMATPQGMAFCGWRCLFRRERRHFAGPQDARRFWAKVGVKDQRRFWEAMIACSGLDQPAMLEWAKPESRSSTTATQPKRLGIPWKQFLNKAGVDYGWTPAMVGTLTYWQLWVYIVEESELGGIQRMSAAQGLAAASKIKREKGKDAKPAPAAQPVQPVREMTPARRHAMAKLAKEAAEAEARKRNGRR